MQLCGSMAGFGVLLLVLKQTAFGLRRFRTWTSAPVAALVAQTSLDVFSEGDFVDFFAALGLWFGLSCFLSFSLGVCAGRCCRSRTLTPPVAERARVRPREAAVTPLAGKRRHSTPPSLARGNVQSPDLRPPVRRTLQFHVADPRPDFPVPILDLQ